MTNDVNNMPHSFRDPMGSVILLDRRVYRFVHQSYKLGVLKFINSSFFNKNCSVGSFPKTQVVINPPPFLYQASGNILDGLILEHQPIFFPIYPHEWTPSMLFDAGQFTINLTQTALAEGFVLKDATPWNVLFSNGRPIFCDMLSFEAWTGSKVWNAYAQFQRTFILPLYAHNHLAWPVHSIFIDRRDGLDPSILTGAIRGWRRWAPFELQAIILPAKLSKGSIVKNEIANEKITLNQLLPNNKLADYVLNRSFGRLRKQLSAVCPTAKQNTQWSDYEDNLMHYTDEEHEEKSNFIRKCLLRSGKGPVLDIGANAGEYSLMAASQGNSVVAADFDVVALDKLYMRVKSEQLPITPVVFNVARPTPAVGWNNSEVESFLTRAKGQFNVLMVLAVLHHLIVTERVPLEYILKLLFELDAKFLIIEWINPNDQRFRQISKTHGALYAHHTEALFRSSLEQRFSILDQLKLAGGTRSLYLCQKN